MSSQLINLSPDLKRLRDDGYEVEIKANYLLIHHVPYVNRSKEIKYGVLISELTLSGDKTSRPNTHVALFSGEYPCHKDGSEINQIRHQTLNQTISDGLIATFSFSNKPSEGYRDYHEKMTRYVEVISSPAVSLDGAVTARTFKVIETPEDDSVFHYLDTASSRVGINAVSKKLKLQKVGIIGLGGTGSYVLDLVAKTPVSEIHIFDGDKFLQHNAFRAPGAASLEELKKVPLKVDYLAAIYSRMHKHIIVHRDFLCSENINDLSGLSFVFICMDKGVAKKLIIEKLEILGLPFVDVGMGIEVRDDSLLGILRITTSTNQKREHIYTGNRIPFSDGGNEDYSQNIQVADLNALNAALAVIKWKKLLGFYQDLEREHHSTYTINVNMLTSDDIL